MSDDRAAPPGANPLLAPWPGPYGGVPPFDRIRAEHFGPALEAALAERRRELAAIRADRRPATFANTAEAIERAGATFRRVHAVFDAWTHGRRDAAFRVVEREWAPRLAAAADEVLLDADLFARLDAAWSSPERATLSPEQRRLLWRHHDRFCRRGARLATEGKARLAAINQRLAALQAEVGQRILAAEAECIVLEGREDLAGLPPGLVAALETAAADHGAAGRWAVPNTRSSVDPFLTFSTRRDLRERVWRAFKERGDGGPHDTRGLVAEIVLRRGEKARLLGFPTYAAWKLADTMAGSPQRARELLARVWAPAVARAGEELAALRRLAAAEMPGAEIAPWDWLHYAERARRERGRLDQGELEPYLRLEAVVAAALWMAGRLHGLAFREITGAVPALHEEARVWEVARGDGSVAGVFYLDPFTRAGKGSGAWELVYREQSGLDGGALPLVSNSNNFVRGRAGEAVTISLDDARVVFHELGHALHDLLSRVVYPSLAGTNVATDFVELPSQLHEHWLLDAELLDRFARHRATGEPMPRALRERVAASRTDGQGYLTVEYLAAAILDLELHDTPGGEVDPAAFEREVLARIGMPPQLAPRHRLPHFGHLFAGEAYAALYYGYLWAETMAADAWAAFEEAGDPWSAGLAVRLGALLAAGDTVDAAELWRAFRGRDPDVAALLRHRGLD